jgi:hypothetical protein
MWWMHVVSIYENRRIKLVEIVLRRGGEKGRGRIMEGVSLRYIVSTYVNVTVYPPVQLLYANKIMKKIHVKKDTSL